MQRLKLTVSSKKPNRMLFKKKTISQPPTIKTIIDSLQNNVERLKRYCYPAEEIVNKTMKRTQSIRKIKSIQNKQNHSSKLNKSQNNQSANIKQIQQSFFKTFGKETTNLIQLYEFYRKNVQKRQKSTRIIGSPELSHENEIEKDSIKEESTITKTMSISNFNKKYQKPSQLAEDLLQKGCYNIVNIANLLNDRKYKLSRIMEQKNTNENVPQKQNLANVNVISPIVKNSQKNTYRNTPVQTKSPLEKNLQSYELMKKQTMKSQSKQIKKSPEISFSKESPIFEKISLKYDFRESPLELHQSPMTQKSKKMLTLQRSPKINLSINQKKTFQFENKSSPQQKQINCHFLSISSEKKEQKQLSLRSSKNQNDISLIASQISCTKNSRIIDLELIPFDL